jgi:F420 biosynthesis protein FbiB-like protein
LDRIFTTAGFAPSAHNRQPWRWLVVTDDDQKGRLATAMGERLAADRAADGDAAEVIARDVARAHARISQAPVLILIALTMAEMDRYPDPRRAAAEHTMAVQSAAMATQSLLLAAHAEGFGTCWMCAPLFCPEVVRGVLDVPDDWEIQGLVTLGRPAREAAAKPRKPLAEIVRRDGPQGGGQGT